MKFKYICKFKVTGSGSFPIDMLRYDRAIPATELDASRIHNTFVPATFDPITVSVFRYTEGKRNDSFGDIPTLRRWESFGWRVSEVKFEKL